MGCLVMGIAGLFITVAAIRTKNSLSAGFGLCFIGLGISRYLANTNELFTFLFVAFAIAMLSLAIALRMKKRAIP